MREDLLGYLLGTLNTEESARVKQAIQEDPALARELERLQECLLADDSEQDGPISPRLIEQTCFLVDACQEGQLEPPAADRRDLRERPHSPRERREPLSPSVRLRWTDSAALLGISLVAAMLFFPAILHSRFRAHVTTCQHNLQQIGYAQTNFSELNQGYFPSVPATGNRAVAGIYAPLLAERHLLPEPGVLICPGSSFAPQRATWRIPTLDELDGCDANQLFAMQRDLGGSYGYNLGYLQDGRLRAVRNKGRFYYALMSDSPTLYRLGLQSDNHAGRGQNVLYEDNHVEFISSDVDTKLIGAIFKNRLGYTEAGLDPADSVIARSSTPPLIVRN